MSFLLSLITLPVIAACVVIFVQSGCRFEFNSNGGGWLACKNAIGNDQIEFLQHQVNDLDRTSQITEQSLRNEINDIRGDMRSKERRFDLASSESATQIRTHVDERLRSMDGTIAELRKLVNTLQSDVNNVDRVFPFKNSFENGLLHWIGTEAGKFDYKNPHDAGFVVASRSSSKDGSARDFVGREFVNSHTDNAVNSWMSVDLGSHRSIIVSHYCMRTRKHYDSTHTLRSWVLEGARSSNSSNWIEISSHKNETTLSKTRVEACWSISSEAVKNIFFRYLRIRITGPNSEKSHFLVNSGIEFFGRVRVVKFNKF